jgi:hypothetical protein
MHHRMPLSNSGWPSLNMVIFPPVLHLVLAVTTPDIIDQIHELILEDRRISAKSVSEQLGISRERVGSIVNEELYMRYLFKKCVPKCLTRIKNFNCASRLSNFWNFLDGIQVISCRGRLVTMEETWLYHYDRETKQQSMEWRHSGSNRPKISE